ncbi:MAG: hypothetical protein JWQ01_459 [Massilia sp.]|nr:hypothetical protein [Massilia sp.]
MKTEEMDDSTNASPDYQQIGRFIYGTARLESALASMLDTMGHAGADHAELAANVRQAEAAFAALPAAEGDRIAFTALMHVLANFAELRDPMFAGIAEMPAEELSARNDSLAAATAEVQRLTAIATALSAREGY